MNTLKLKQIPVINYSECTLCEKCIASCPNGVIRKNQNSGCAKCMKYCITMDVPCSPENYIFNYSHCDACGACISACPSGAIYWWKNLKQ